MNYGLTNERIPLCSSLDYSLVLFLFLVIMSFLLVNVSPFLDGPWVSAHERSGCSFWSSSSGTREQ